VTGAGILVLSVAAGFFTWYHTLSYTSRNADSPWFAVLLGVMVFAGGVMLAVGVET
jgi:hypothetical protein